MGSQIESLRGVLFNAANVAKLRTLRNKQVGDLAGTGLEVGVGTGNNLPHYAANVDRLVVLDAATGMQRQARSRMKLARMPVQWVRGWAEDLPFAEASFDFVVSTLLLCGASDPVKVLSEIYRVLKPGGQYRFLEHGCHHSAPVAVWQKRLNPLQRLVAGCELTRDVAGLITDSPLSVQTIWTREVFGGPGKLFPLTGGVAVRRV